MKVTNLKRNSSLTAVERCKNPNLQKRLGFSFCTFQVLKWRSGLTRVVSTYTYAAPCYRNKHPLPPQISTTKFQPWQIKTVTPPLIRPGKRIWTSCNDAYRTQMDVNGWCTPPPIPMTGYFWTWSIRSVSTPPELHNTPGEKFMGRSYIRRHSFQGQTGFRTTLNRKWITFGIIQNQMMWWFR